MPLYRFRLEEQEGKHYRAGTISADTEDAARAFLERKEDAAAVYRLTTDELADLEGQERAAADNGVAAPGAGRARLASHRQEKPYKLKSLKAVEGGEE